VAEQIAGTAAGSKSGPAPRRYELDWLRTLVVLGIIPYHALVIFGASSAVYIKSVQASPALALIGGFVLTWGIPSIFLMAGAATRLALAHRGPGAYVRERLSRLLVPMLLVALVFSPLQAYFILLSNPSLVSMSPVPIQNPEQLSNFGTFYGTYLGILVTTVRAYSPSIGTLALAHVWFIPRLLVVSLLTSLLVLVMRRYGQRLLVRMTTLDQHPLVILFGGGLATALVFALLRPGWLEGLTAHWLFTDVWSDFFLDLFLFLCGYLIYSYRRLREAVGVLWIFTLAVGIVCWAAVAGVTIAGKAPSASFALPSLVYALGLALSAWLISLGLLGAAMRYLTFTTPEQRYLSDAAFPVYLLHMSVLTISAYYLLKLPLPWYLQLLLIIAVTVVVAFGLFDLVVRRTPVTRFLFGVRRLGPQDEASAALSSCLSSVPMATSAQPSKYIGSSSSWWLQLCRYQPTASRRAMQDKMTRAVSDAGTTPSSRRRSLQMAWDIWRAGKASPSALGVLQHERFADLITFAREHSAYYRALYHDLSGEVVDFSALPVVTKPNLMAHFEQWVTDPSVTWPGIEAFVADPATIGELFQGHYSVWTTSGTTGQPGIFVHDPQAVRLYYTVGLFRSTSIMGLLSWSQIGRLLRRGSRNALLAATGGHFAGTVETEHLRRHARWLANSGRIFSVLQPLSTLVRELNAFQPSRVGGYPTALLLLADEQLAGRLHIHPTMLTPSGEWLGPVGRKKLERAFGCPVRMVYSASEFMGIGFECREGWIHVNADWVILEPVDASYRPVLPGRPSYTVLLTNLANRVQPFIRYDLGDSVTQRPDACPCGCQLPALRVEGRKGDILYFPARSCEEGGSLPLVAVLPLAVGTMLEKTPGVRRVQLIQTGSSTLTVRLEGSTGGSDGSAASEEVWDRVQQQLRQYLADQDVAPVSIVRSQEPPQSDPASGKFRQVGNEVPPASAAHAKQTARSAPTGYHRL
jgi:phenylacetate-CoA ligase